MIDKNIGKNCTGCTACRNICPKNAITMREDREGFFYPVVEQEQCVSCGLCISVCPVLHFYKKEAYQEPEVYAGWNLEDDIRISSTSGGVFTALAEAVMERGGYVAGAIYDEQFSICHIVTDQKEMIPLLRQSKYAQSALSTVYREIKGLLDRGEMVLFCGTPCQSAGLQQYLKKDYEKSYFCDFICRGVISQKVYHKFLDDTAKQKKSTLKTVQFKNKDFGWNQFSTKLSFENQSIYQKDRNQDSYMRGYLKHNLFIRPSCSNCKFKEIPRNSDLSLGDFWGISNYNKELDNDRGTSVILVNSRKGKELLGWSKDRLFLEQRSLDEVLLGNQCLLHSAPAGEFRAYFFDHMDHESFEQLLLKIDRKAQHLTWKDIIMNLRNGIKTLFKRRSSNHEQKRDGAF